jgi:tetratricopeptide (TPR) repeat protein
VNYFKNTVKYALLMFAIAFFVSCASQAAKAEEYFSLGTAYFELQKYAEAESWFNRAKFHRTTKTASEYNLGRIAFETGRYREAKTYFERIIRADGENVTALRAAAYACIKLEELEQAGEYYRRILELVPESYDSGFNYALILLALGKAEEAESVLLKYNTEDPKALVVLARAQKQQGKPEALDAYSASLVQDDDPAVRAEFAAYLEESGLRDKALAEYRRALEHSKLTETQKKEIQAAMAALETEVEGGAKAEQKTQ